MCLSQRTSKNRRSTAFWDFSGEESAPESASNDPQRSVTSELPPAAAGLPVVALRQRARVPVPVHRQLQRHLSEHLTHRHLWQRGRMAGSAPATPATPATPQGGTCSKRSVLNMEMLIWLFRPIFTWNFLIPSLLIPNRGKVVILYLKNVGTMMKYPQ